VAGSTSKRVLVARFDRAAVKGFINPRTWLGADGIEVLTPEGSLTRVPYAEVRFVCFVRDFDQQEPRREMRIFLTRPKMNGLWVRLRLHDGEALEGVMSNDPLGWEVEGFSLVPPDPNYQNQRLFVPRASIAEMRILGVIGGAARKRSKKPERGSQLEMFNDETV
jgi:hypothetical protein